LVRFRKSRVFGMKYLLLIATPSGVRGRRRLAFGIGIGVMFVGSLIPFFG
jgi:hypothetical protein